ncbi:MAG: hypothetical protein ACI9OO_000287 [Bacteroidia bacterium]|jgi:uncharacterized protein (DUF2344 family)
MTKNQTKTQTTFEKANAVARDLFLANLGLYGKAFEQSQETYKQAGEKVQALIGKRETIYADLVKRGEKVQVEAQAKFEELSAKPKTLVEEQVAAVKSSVEKLKERVASRKTEVQTATAQA